MTQIFKSYSEFLSREDVKVNGVSPEFTERNPEYEKQNETNDGCWNCSDCSGCSRCYDCSDCYRCSDCSDCYRCSDCSYCSDCYRCSDCSDCYRCSDCSDCYRCSDCSDCSLLTNASPREMSAPSFDIPVIEDIHQKVFEAASRNDESLNMDSWHTCDTTHCRAGWVTFLAGEKGAILERKTSTLFAAMQIYKASSPIKVSPPRFFEPNTKALDDMRKCAEAEKSQTV
jgi:hypothetical protein